MSDKLTTAEALELASTNKNCREYLDRLKRKDNRTDEELCSLEIVKTIFKEYRDGVNSGQEVD